MPNNIKLIFNTNYSDSPGLLLHTFRFFIPIDFRAFFKISSPSLKSITPLDFENVILHSKIEIDQNSRMKVWEVLRKKNLDDGFIACVNGKPLDGEKEWCEYQIHKDATVIVQPTRALCGVCSFFDFFKLLLTSACLKFWLFVFKGMFQFAKNLGDLVGKTEGEQNHCLRGFLKELTRWSQTQQLLAWGEPRRSPRFSPPFAFIDREVSY